MINDRRMFKIFKSIAGLRFHHECMDTCTICEAHFNEGVRNMYLRGLSQMQKFLLNQWIKAIYKSFHLSNNNFRAIRLVETGRML
jgi:hypothetical protein